MADRNMSIIDDEKVPVKVGKLSPFAECKLQNVAVRCL